MADPFARYKDVDFEQMKRVEEAIIKAVLPFKESTDPLLAVLALVRVTRAFLRNGTKEAQRTLLPVLFAYLEGRTQIPGDLNDAGKLWTPGSRGN